MIHAAQSRSRRATVFIIGAAAALLLLGLLFTIVRSAYQLDTMTETNRNLTQRLLDQSEEIADLRQQIETSQVEAEKRSALALKQRQEQTRQLRTLERLLRMYGIDPSSTPSPSPTVRRQPDGSEQASTPAPAPRTQPPSEARPAPVRPAPQPARPTPARPQPTAPAQPADEDQGVLGNLLDLLF